MLKKANILLVKLVLSLLTIVILTISERLISTHLYPLDRYRIWCDIVIVLAVALVSMLFDFIQSRRKKRVQQELKDITDAMLKKYDKE